MKVRRSEERGHFDFGWLKTYHSFSFGEYFDRNNMHFSDLRVINHDYIAPSSGFPTHPHKDMEIITYVLSGTVEHQDSMRNKTQIHAGEVQTMSAGAGVLHSEYNPSKNDILELIQIWVMPKQKGGNPGYAQKKFSIEDQQNKFLKIISGSEEQVAMPIRQDIEIYAAIIDQKQTLSFPIQANKKYWLQVVEGELKVNSELLKKGDALSVEEKDSIQLLNLTAEKKSEILLFQLRPEV